ncbi:LamG domain-containing protein [Leptospira brenneri]|uniref:LamG domain-containing protein n=1 Tax=Leptospira brenneri TaxID=2023182 RepID=A0A5F1ZCA0_9LEPT|nr:LamG domain-containing protein [Leptospira brenneri]TGK97129.1 LamG domain-containing protein [Leptospira brenneri]
MVFVLVCRPLQFNNVGDLQTEARRETIILECLLGGKYCSNGFKIQQYIVPASLASGLYAWYPLDGNTSDLSGNANHGYFPGGSWPATLGPSYTFSRSNLPNGTASFNGTDQLFSSDFAPVCNEDFSIALWIFPNNATNNQILGFQQGNGSNPGVMLALNGTGHFEFSSYFSYWNNQNLTHGASSTVLSANVWTHITYVHSGATQQGTIWVNGVNVGATADTVNVSNVTGCITGSLPFQWWTGTPLNIGYGYSNPRFFSGKMDDIWFFKGRQLNANDISTLMDLP